MINESPQQGVPGEGIVSFDQCAVSLALVH